MADRGEYSEREIREDPLTGSFVIISPSRRGRPGATEQGDRHADSLGRERCPFCPGRESEIPPILFQGNALADSRPWHTRVFVNKYPALAPVNLGGALNHGCYRTWPGEGVHEVIVETPHHDEDLFAMPVESVEHLLATYAARVAEVRSKHPRLYPALFKNYGRKAGATLRHPHSQLIATPVLPTHVREREDRMRRVFEEDGCCAVCRLVVAETGIRERVIWEDDHFIAFVPFAAESMCETMIVPRRHCSDLSDIDSSERTSLARAISALTGALERTLDQPSYNILFMLPSTPLLETSIAHWYMVLRPRYGVEAGFEQATGMRINASWPESDAELLRSAAVHVQAA